ncbi:MAG: aminopeptidase [bacterium]
MDPRYVKLAEGLVGYSTRVKKGDIVFLKAATCVPKQMILAIIQAVKKAGGVMLDPWLHDDSITAASRATCTDRSLRIEAASQYLRYLGSDVNLVIRGIQNPYEAKAVLPDIRQRVSSILNGMCLPEQIDHSRWVLTGWPTDSFAQMMGIPKVEAEEFFFKAVLADYPAMVKAVGPLVKLMEKTDQVRIVGPGTDLTFSIKGIPVVPCVGKRNKPDGEIYTAPVLDSANGTIQYNTTSVAKNGEAYGNIRFEINNGRIIKATCQTGNEINMNIMLDTDEGSRRFGEFALGINWDITRIVGDTLFDEKVGGTFHLTPGNAYKMAPNGNHSSIHWDIVCDQRKSAGGGEIWFDGVLVRKDGLFVLPKLAGLNPPGSRALKRVKAA